MRLNNQEIEAIRKARDEIFGKDIKVYLFGSRTDDSKRGGDIDIYVDTYIDLDHFIDFKYEILEKIGDQKLDIIDKKASKNFINIIKNDFLKIC